MTCRPLTNPNLDLNLYFPKLLSLYTIPLFTRQLSSLSSTHGMTNCIGTEGVKVNINKSQSTQSLPAYQCFKGELDIKHATR